ncbi:Glutamate--cysteine ligase [Arachis hypogaea]|nr:Glutamate--cysteine ligase [Arachis hypogaea]
MSSVAADPSSSSLSLASIGVPRHRHALLLPQWSLSCKPLLDSEPSISVLVVSPSIGSASTGVIVELDKPSGSGSSDNNGCSSRKRARKEGLGSAIGTEHEKFGFEFGSLRPMKYEQIAELLNGIAERFEWDKIMEGDKIIGLKQGKQNISLEPGGQFELSGAPLETLHQTYAEVNSHQYQVKAVAEEMGIGFLGMGFQPKWGIKDIPIMPNVRCVTIVELIYP